MPSFCFWTSAEGETVSVRHEVVDGAHFFTSHAVPGLCAAHRDPAIAFAAVAPQLDTLVSRRTGEPIAFHPDATAEALLARLAAPD